jgi:hypothetical protein
MTIRYILSEIALREQFVKNGEVLNADQVFDPRELILSERRELAPFLRYEHAASGSPVFVGPRGFRAPMLLSGGAVEDFVDALKTWIVADEQGVELG